MSDTPRRTTHSAASSTAMDCRLHCLRQPGNSICGVTAVVVDEQWRSTFNQRHLQPSVIASAADREARAGNRKSMPVSDASGNLTSCWFHTALASKHFQPLVARLELPAEAFAAESIQASFGYTLLTFSGVTSSCWVNTAGGTRLFSSISKASLISCAP